ncbi:MAG: polyprenyl synthetase family protein [Desulfovibrionaceae bacterium]|nr:polyprenyl synthetase family protein [Desulfovibrionaceae bacterium]
MASLLLKSTLALELPKINKALTQAHALLPDPVKPVAEHIFKAGGKRLRPFLTVLTGRLLGYDQDAIYRLAITLEMLHAATLLHDDVIDDAPLRRGQPAAHTKFSLTETILAGDALLAMGNAIVAEFNDPMLSSSFSKATSDTCAGEINEIRHQHDPNVSEATYFQIILGKTARLISCACEMGAILAHASKDQISASLAFGENIGIAFQLVDDALDFESEKITGKPTAGDLREGKMTLPVRYYLETLDNKAKEDFLEQFKRGSFTPDACQEIAAKIKDLALDQKTRTCANMYLAKAIDALNTLPDRQEKKLLLAMTDYVRDRKK